MEQERISVPAANLVARAYISGSKQTGGFFEYYPVTEQSFEKRAREVTERAFQRKELAAVIRAFMAPEHLSREVKQSLEKLENPKSVAVVGGQQAGLLTGPLYAVHKIISILHVAKQQENKLARPVVPVFWIAGEDHDLQEINHIFLEKNGRMQKAGYPERILKKQAASHTPFEQESMFDWVDSVFAALHETKYTNELRAEVKKAVKESRTFTQFFARITGSFFSKHGLLLVDAADPALRKLEAPFFKKMIEENDELAAAVQETQQHIREAGYDPVIEAGENPAHLFVTEEGERHLLEKENGRFVSKSGRSYSKADLLQLLEKEPEAFSNNVVTRPLMQEWLFPTLAFIAGPGEIAYWAELKGAFRQFNMKMPPVVPRLNLTIVERDVAGHLADLNIEAASAVQRGVAKQKEAYLESVRDAHLHDLVEQMKQKLDSQYQQIEQRAEQLQKGLLPIVEKNREFHQRQFDVLLQKSDAVLQQTHQAVLNKFDRIEASLHPEGLQERIWNIYPFLNVHGPGLIDRLMEQDYCADGGHYLLYV